MQAIREVTDCARIYTFSLGESVPHYHLHMIPRTDSMPRVYRARGVMQYPLVPTADEALVAETCSRLKNAIARLTPGCKQK
jgi:diadenosine tetraphosphate (Ap4A) HIT family hydrolase